MKKYVKRWLEMPVQEKTGDLRAKSGKGTPQGVVISPLLADLFLHYGLDKWQEKQYPDIRYVRYAYDGVVHFQSEEEAKDLLNAIRERLITCKLNLHEGKTKIEYCQDYRMEAKPYPKKFDFLGFSFRPRPKRSKRQEG